MSHPNVALLQRLDDAFNQGDFDAALALFAENCRVHIAGRSKFAGEHVGRETMAAITGQYVEALGEDPEIETHAILADDEHGIMLQRVKASKHGQSVDIKTVNIFHISNGQITEMWTMDDDPYLADSFYDS